MKEATNTVNTKVYIKDKEFAWLPARILAIDDHVVTVRIELALDWEETTLGGESSYDLDGKVVQVSAFDYCKGVLPRRNQQLCRDMADLPYLNEAAILYQIKDRHVRQKPYTRVAEIIVAVNPCHFVPNIYSEDEQKKYAIKLVYYMNNSGGGDDSKGECVDNRHHHGYIAPSVIVSTHSHTLNLVAP
jgi:myosin heavy subunit